MGRSQPYLIVPLLLENTDRTPSFFTDLVSMTGTDDTDLDGMAISALSFIPECQFPLSTAIATVAQVINTIEGDLLPAAGVSAAGDIASLTATVDEEDKTRRKKLLALAYLQVFFFRHLAFAFDGPVTASITQLVSKLVYFWGWA